MNTYEVLVSMIVRVEAPSSSDAKDAVSDAFDVGEFCGFDVKEVETTVMGYDESQDV